MGKNRAGRCRRWERRTSCACSARSIFHTYRHCHLDTGAVSGADMAFALGEDPARVRKTLVTTGQTGRYYVFLPPVTAALD